MAVFERCILTNFTVDNLVNMHIAKFIGKFFFFSLFDSAFCLDFFAVMLYNDK